MPNRAVDVITFLFVASRARPLRWPGSAERQAK